MAYTDIDDPSEYFQTKLYTGTNNELVLTFDGNSDIQPNMIWTKNSGRAANHVLSYTVRGIGKGLYPDLTNAEGDTNYISAIGSDGYTIVATDSVEINRDDDTFVSWNWKTGTSFTNDASSTSVGTIDSVGSVNTDAGFSIISFTGTGSAGTIAHGLGAVPAWYIVKRRNASEHWQVYHARNTSAPATDYLQLSTAEATTDADTRWNDTNPTSTVFSVNTHASVNADASTYVAYCWAEKQGFSKFGSYIGNGNANGTFVHTGFKPAFVLIKIIDNGSQDWFILDNKRSPFNLTDDSLAPNQNDQEYTSEANLDFLSNGFKLRMTSIRVNGAGSNYIYAAFAENPFVTSTGIPGTAR